jgi:hypothetical protein
MLTNDSACNDDQNDCPSKTDWQFRKTDTKIDLDHFYPELKICQDFPRAVMKQ